MLHCICLLVEDTLVTQDIDQLLHKRIVRRAKAAIVFQRFLCQLDVEDTTTHSANEHSDQLEEDNLPLCTRQAQVILVLIQTILNI